MSPWFPEAAYEGGNAILDRLPPAERANLLPDLIVATEEETRVLRMRDDPIDGAHFPIDCVYSVVVELAQGHTYEVDVVGRGGVIGAELAIGGVVAPRTVVCQVGGHVAYLPRDRFSEALGVSHTFLTAVRESLRRQWFVSQQTVACNFAHTPEQRTARWILMTHDQIGRDRFPLRAEFLSIMLGMSTSAVREPLTVLEQLGCIQFAEEQVAVIERRELHGFACECYEEQRSARFIAADGAP